MHSSAEKKGLTIWLTGLPSAGKSTIARKIATLLEREGLRVPRARAEASSGRRESQTHGHQFVGAERIQGSGCHALVTHFPCDVEIVKVSETA